MKYNSSNKPLVCMQTTSTCYQGTRQFTPKGILWHCTGANNPKLSRYVQPSDNAANRADMLKILGTNPNHNDWNHKYVSAGLNFWIGKLANGKVAAVQTMPWNYRPWGCGSGARGTLNDTHIQFEMCEDALTDSAYFNACYKEGIEMTAYLCKMYNIDPLGTITYNGIKVPTILCHYDSYHLGCGSNHGDVYNWFKKHNKTMDDVRNDVAKLLKGESEPVTPSTPVDNKEDTIAKNPESFIKQIAPYVRELAPRYGITCNSAVIAQACLESAYGTSNKAKYHNYFGLKYRANRVSCNSGTFTDSSKEQNPDGSYIGISTQWYKFANMKDGVEGYFQFINIDNYKNVKNVSDPQKYLENIRSDGYATSLSYVTNVMNVVNKYNLTQYDKKSDNASQTTPATSTTPTVKKVPTITYGVKVGKTILSDVKNGQIAGTGKKIMAIKIGVDYGKIEYRVHCDGKWLPKVTGNNWNDYDNGYAGDDKHAIDAIQIYYTSDKTKTDGCNAVYQVKPIGKSYLPEVYDTNWEKTDGDKTAGLFKKPFGEIKISLKKG